MSGKSKADIEAQKIVDLILESSRCQVGLELLRQLIVRAESEGAAVSSSIRYFQTEVKTRERKSCEQEQLRIAGIMIAVVMSNNFAARQATINMLLDVVVQNYNYRFIDYFIAELLNRGGVAMEVARNILRSLIRLGDEAILVVEDVFIYTAGPVVDEIYQRSYQLLLELMTDSDQEIADFACSVVLLILSSQFEKHNSGGLSLITTGYRSKLLIGLLTAKQDVKARGFVQTFLLRLVTIDDESAVLLIKRFFADYFIANYQQHHEFMVKLLATMLLDSAPLAMQSYAWCVLRETPQQYVRDWLQLEREIKLVKEDLASSLSVTSDAQDLFERGCSS